MAIQAAFCCLSFVLFFAQFVGSYRHKDFVLQEILELLAGKCTSEHKVPPFCVNPLSVAEGKKLHLVIDLRKVNEFLVKPKFRYENLCSLSQAIEKGYWFSTWDICDDHQQYLGFS